MRAAVCRTFGQALSIEEVELDPAGPGEVVVQVSACGVCHSDISYLDGDWGGTVPAVYGHEVAGTVRQVGRDVDGLAPGDHVVVTIVRSCGRCYFCRRSAPALCETGFSLDETSPLRLDGGTRVAQGLRVGGFAELVTVHSSQVVAIPRDVPPESACLLACAVPSGVGAVLNGADTPAGATIVVVGVGGVGINSVQGAALAGADAIVAVDVSNERLEAARRLGATHAVNPRTADPVEAIPELTDGRGADCAVVTATARAVIEQSVELVRRAGTVVLVGMPAAGVTVELDPGQLAHDGRRIVGSKIGSLRPQLDLPQLVEHYREGRLKLDELVSGRYRLEDVNEAVEATRRAEGIRNVIVFS